MVCNLTNRLWLHFLQLNIYKKSSDTQQSTFKDLIATRIYICALALIILAIAFAATFYGRTINSIEYSPSSSRFAQLIERYPSTLHCPCSKFSITYSTFVSVQIQFHQVCSSEFIQQTFINQIFDEYQNLSSTFDDHRLTLTFFWQIISDVCSISNQTWTNIITSFNGSYIFSPTAINQQSVENQVQNTLKYEKSLLQSTLIRNLHLLQRFITGNELVSGRVTNFELRYADDKITPKMFPRKYDNCSCVNIDGCPHPATISKNSGQIITISGMIADCLIIDGTLASTLECYYDKTCISLLHESSTMNHIQPLSTNKNKYFTKNSTIQTLFDEIMAEEVVEHVEYDLYYSQCNPSFCTYSYVRHFDIMFVVTTIIGLVGTFSMIIYLIAPIIAVAYLRYKNKANSNSLTVVKVMTIEQKQRLSLFSRLRQIIVEFNLFEGETTRTVTIVHRERILTRCFILLMITATAIIAFYIFFQKQSQTITIAYPSIDTYHQLYDHYSDSLKCPCSNLSISYETFTNVSITLHQVCSSDLISPDWLKYVALFDRSQIPSWTETPFSRDFRLLGASYFQLLNTFCSIAKTNTKTFQERFSNRKLISDYVRSPVRLIEETKSIINSFIDTTNNTFVQEYQWLSVFFMSSHFLSGTNINFEAVVNADHEISLNPATIMMIGSISGGNIYIRGYCQCDGEFVSLLCKIITMIYSNGSNFFEYDEIYWQMSIGCLPIAGLMQGYINWWYNETSLKNIQNTYAIMLQSQRLPDLKPLNESLSTQFSVYTQLQELLGKMFIEEWTVDEIDFDRFYSECAPISCSYTIYERRPILTTILLIIAICGGLNKGLRIIVLFLGKTIFITINKWKNRNTVSIHIRHIPRSFYEFIVNLNLFETIEQDEKITRKQKLYTKVYLILFLSCLLIILFYTAIIRRSVVRTYSVTSLEEYEHLYNLYGDAITCPCTQISILYEDFVTDLKIDTFHEVCKPNAITNVLMDVIRYDYSSAYANRIDFRYSHIKMYDLIGQLCQLAKESANTSIQVLLSSSTINNQLTPVKQFNSEIKETLTNFQTKTVNTFTQTLDLMRTTMQGNALIATSGTNWQFVVNEEDQETNTTFLPHPIVYNNTSCSCATSALCTMPAQLFDDNGTLVFTMEGFVLACHLLESVLQSSLSCLYSISCINSFREAYYPSDYFQDDDWLLANTSFNSEITRFYVNDTIDTLASQMFIESWMSNISYEKYYNSCALHYCSYTEYYLFDAFDLLTIFLSVFGGLSAGLRLIIPHIVDISAKIHNRFCIVSMS